MSPKTKSKVKKYLVTWVQAVSRIKKSRDYAILDKKPYLTFVTLTLPAKQNHDDNHIKRTCLTPFIENLKRKHNVWNYFWRAESQKNGNIHFHLLIDSFINHTVLRDLWNHTVEKLGYIDTFEKEHKHRNPNSTDIRKLKGIHNPEAYVIKYCCKAEGYRPIKGRIHGCSDALRKLTPYECLVDNNTSEFIEEAYNDKKSKILEGDCYTIILCNTQYLLKRTNRQLAQHISKYYIQTAIDLYTSYSMKNKTFDRPPVRPLVNKPYQIKLHF
jgi:hypothetical protein